MNAFVKVCASVLAVGAVLCAVGAAAGGTVYSTLDGSGLHPWNHYLPRLQGIPDLDAGTRASNDVDTGVIRNGGSVWEGERLPARAAGNGGVTSDGGAYDASGEAYAGAQLDKLDIEIGGGKLVVIEGDDFAVTEGADDLESRLENGTWKIRTKSGFSWKARSCTITVPAGCSIQSLDLELGGGSTEIHVPLTARRAEFEVGAGSVEVFAPFTTERIDLEVGAGSMAFDSLTVTDRVKADVGMGSISLDLTGSVSDYTTRADVAMGTVEINDRTFVSGMAKELTEGNGPLLLDLEVGMGSVEIFTENE